MSRPRREQRRCPLRLPTNRRYALREGPAPSAHRLAARPKGLDREPGPSLRASLPRREPPPSLRSGDYSRRELLGDGGPTSPVSAFDSGHRESSETLGITLAARVVSRSNRGRRRAPRERSDCAEIRRAVEGRIRPSRLPVGRRPRSRANREATVGGGYVKSDIPPSPGRYLDRLRQKPRMKSSLRESGICRKRESSSPMRRGPARYSHSRYLGGRARIRSRISSGERVV